MDILKKRIPSALLGVGYVLITLILFSTMGMFLGLLIGNGHKTHQQMSQMLFIFSPLMPFYWAPLDLPYGMLILTFIIVITTWLLSTRIRTTNKTLMRRSIAFIYPWGTFTLLAMLMTMAYAKPISYDLIWQIDDWVKTPKYREYLHPGGLKFLGWFVMLIPSYAIIRFWIKVAEEYRSDPLLQEWFENYKFQWGVLGRFGDDRANIMPDIVLALEADSKAPVVLSGESRQLGTMLIGPPGSGKTSLKIIKAFRQDLEHLQNAINTFPDYVKKYGYGTPAFHKAWGNHLIGSIIVEPAKDLCDKAYELTLEHGIPEEFVVYLDPSNPDTPGFNCLVGPLSQVAETLTAVLDSMSESSDEFFRQSSRTVLKAYIYLLKFVLKDECTLLDLDRMYQDPRYTADLVEILESKLPDHSVVSRMNRDRRIFWMLARRTVQWFRNDGIEIETSREGIKQRFADGPHKGKFKYIDKQFEFTRTTRNLLSDLLQNPYAARVLLGENRVDLDKLMSRGGILLCNTANGELGDISSAFGKLVYMSVQNAVFRRKGDEKTRPLVSSYADEFLEYMNTKFLKLTSQGRKYKYAPLVATQTLSQFDIELGRGFVDGMIGTIRNYIVYGGVGNYDAEKLSKIFGSTTVEESAIRDSITPENMNSPNYSISQSTTRKDMELVTADQIMFNKFKYSYIRLVVEGSTVKAIKALGDFVDFGRAEKWKRNLKSEALEQFLEHWRQSTKEEEQFDVDWIDEDSETVDDAEMGLSGSIDSGTKGNGNENQPNEAVNVKSEKVAKGDKGKDDQQSNQSRSPDKKQSDAKKSPTEPRIDTIGPADAFHEIPKVASSRRKRFTEIQIMGDQSSNEAKHSSANEGPQEEEKVAQSRQHEPKPQPAPIPPPSPVRKPAQQSLQVEGMVNASDLLFAGMNPPTSSVSHGESDAMEPASPSNEKSDPQKKVDRKQSIAQEDDYPAQPTMTGNPDVLKKPKQMKKGSSVGSLATSDQKWEAPAKKRMHPFIVSETQSNEPLFFSDEVPANREMETPFGKGTTTTEEVPNGAEVDLYIYDDLGDKNHDDAHVQKASNVASEHEDIKAHKQGTGKHVIEDSPNEAKPPQQITVTGIAADSKSASQEKKIDQAERDQQVLLRRHGKPAVGESPSFKPTHSVPPTGQRSPIKDSGMKEFQQAGKPNPHFEKKMKLLEKQLNPKK